MYCNKRNVNHLTAALLAYGVEDAVVCPGSRNAPIVHNLHTAATTGAPLRLHPITDERSAAFVAIGLWLCTRRPIVVCVTSGSAILNLLPGVAEADFRHIPLIIISADRPARWIGQLDGQTLPQPGALRPYADSWILDEDTTDQDLATTCHQAFAELSRNGGRPVHINVPLDEPLFEFNVEKLKTISLAILSPGEPEGVPDDLLEIILRAKHPAIIVGQYEDGPIPALKTLKEHGWTIYAENISNQQIFNDHYVPTDLLIHIGGALVGKRLKQQLRQQADLTIIRIDETDQRPATFGHLDYKVCAHPAEALQQIVEAMPPLSGNSISADSLSTDILSPLKAEPEGVSIEALILGNSTAVRWCNTHLHTHVPTYCNRGTNGIEGTLSVAAGYSLATDAPVVCILGDLSFFYDANALWNERLRGNLRILLVNNHRGDIFYHLPGLDASPALHDYIAAAPSSSAAGISAAHRCTYLHATTHDLAADIAGLLHRLLTTPSDRPVVLEVTQP